MYPLTVISPWTFAARGPRCLLVWPTVWGPYSQWFLCHGLSYVLYGLFTFYLTGWLSPRNFWRVCICINKLIQSVPMPTTHTCSYALSIKETYPTKIIFFMVTELFPERSETAHSLLPLGLTGPVCVIWSISHFEWIVTRDRHRGTFLKTSRI